MSAPALPMALIDEAARVLAPVLPQTPVELSLELSEAVGAPVWLKLDCAQVTGSFKIRGAYFRLSRLSADERARGVVSCSAGNHGKALAWSGQRLGVRVRIWVPNHADPSKIAGMRSHGADLVVADTNSYDDAEALARAEATHRGLPFVSAFEDEAVMAGNGGTLALEIAAQVPLLRTCLIPVSGGGLGAGLVSAFEAQGRRVRVIGCQHADSPSFALSLARGAAVTEMPGIDTMAGGIEGGIGAANFAILRGRVDPHVGLCHEADLYRGVAWLLARHQLLVEPSGAVTVAALLAGQVPRDLQGPVVCVLTGRNLSLSNLRRILAALPEDSA